MIHKFSVFFFICIFALFSAVFAQISPVWTVGIHAGMSAYSGDITQHFFSLNPKDFASRNFSAYNSRAAGISLAKRLNPNFSLTFQGLYGNADANDRSNSRNPNFARALNFRTEFYDANILINYHFSNGIILKENARFQPYLGVGIGVSHFTVFADQYTGDGSRYYYWADGTIRNLAENAPNAANASLLEQDGQFETRLSQWQTEGRKTPSFAVAIPVTVGVQWRLNNRWRVSLEANGRYLFTDYFDNISGNNYTTTYTNPQSYYLANPNPNWHTSEHETRGNSNQAKDKYGALLLGVHFCFEGKKQLIQECLPQPLEKVDKFEPPRPLKLPEVVEQKDSEQNLQKEVDSLAMEIQKLKAKLAENTPAMSPPSDTRVQSLEKTIEILRTETADLRQSVKVLTEKIQVMENQKTIFTSSENKTSLYFSINSTALSKENQAILEGIVLELTNNPTSQCYLKGFADRQGNSLSNQALSEKRVAGIRNFLIEKGIVPSRIFSQSLGDKFPVYHNALDRRVEITIKAEK